MILQVAGVSHAFAGQSELIKDVGFEASSGEMVALTGPSGSGKSTLLAILAGWITPRQGSIQRQGSTGFAWVPQNPYGVARRTALDHVTLPALARGVPRAEAIRLSETLLELFEIGRVARTPFFLLSGGEAQRLMLARAVASRASLILVDEPTAQLDPASAVVVAGVLGRLSSDGAVVVVATHDPSVARVCGKHVQLGQR